MANLILVPTLREMDSLQRLRESGAAADCAFQICGFGPIAAAARASALIARYKPERVMLIGIAGSFDIETYPLGTACRFDRVACMGVGIGSGTHHRDAHEMGWYQFSGGDAQPEIGDVIALDSTFVDGFPLAGLLLTCCSASGNSSDAAMRRKLFPDAVGEDMEGFAVAMSCALARVPLQIVRGISNQVGDRNSADWLVDEALDAAADMAIHLMPRTWMPSPS